MAKYCFDLTGLKEYLKGVRNHRVSYRGFEFELNRSSEKSRGFVIIYENGACVSAVYSDGSLGFNPNQNHLEAPITHALGILSSMAEEDFCAEMFQPVEQQTEQPDEIITDRQEKINTADVVVHSDECCAEPEHNIPETNTAPEPLAACAGLTMLAPITRTGTTWPGLLGVEEQK